MRSLEINKVKIWYALYLGKEDILDENGDSIGETRKAYSLPVPIKIRVTPNRGEAVNQFFGTMLDYDSIMIVSEEDELPIDEYSLLWIRKTPELVDGAYPVDDSGNLITGHTHTVTMVAEDINVTQYAIKRVNSNA